MMAKTKTLFFILVIIILGGCISEKNIKITEYKGVKIKRLTNSELLLDVVVDIVNDGNKITLKEFNINLTTREGYTLTNIHSEKEVVVAKGVTNDLTIPIAGSLPGGFLSALSLTSALSSGSENVMVVGNIKVQIGIISKNIKLECSLKELANNLGLKDINLNIN